MNISTDEKTFAKINDDRDEYRSVFRRQVFELLKRGYDRLVSSKYKHVNEEIITGELGVSIQNIIEDRSSPSWAWQFAVHIENPINSKKRKGKNRLRIDIEFERTGRGKHPRYPFEAKRLSSGTHATIGEYIGTDGLDQFLSGNYAKDNVEAGMLAYVQTETPQHWALKTEKRFKKDANRLKIHLDDEWVPFVILPSFDHCYRSKHDRPVIKKPITIYHVFLSFC